MTEEEKKTFEDRYHYQINDGHEFRLKQTAFVGALVHCCWSFGSQRMSELNHPRERTINTFLIRVLVIVFMAFIVILLFCVS